jgi:hypothetical protein
MCRLFTKRNAKRHACVDLARTNSEAPTLRLKETTIADTYGRTSLVDLKHDGHPATGRPESRVDFTGSLPHRGVDYSGFARGLFWAVP